MKPKEFTLFDADQNRLDDRWRQLPREYHKWVLRHADASMELEQAKAAKDLAEADKDKVAAEIDQAIRRDPSKFGLEKVTEGAVEKLTLLQPTYNKARDDVFSARQKVINVKHDMDIIKAHVDAMEFEKKSLENQVFLWARAYFADPKLPDELSDDRRDAFRKRNEEIASKAFKSTKSQSK